MVVLAGLSACAGGRVPATVREFLAFGTQVRLEIRGEDPARASAAADAVEAFFHRVDNDWYAFGNGELGRVNAALARGEAVTVSESLAPLIARAIELHARSDGFFDPGVCALVRLWHFDREENLDIAGDRPAADTVRALRAQQGTMADVQLKGRALSTRRPLCIDLGGMAKGTAADHARRLLEAGHVENALLDVGGSSLLALGRHASREGGRPWRIGLRDPRSTTVIGVLELDPGESADTSGDYERSYTAGGRRYHHVLDPRTGEPAEGVASVTVIARDAELADAASTALMVGGATRFESLAAALGVTDALLITTTGEMRMTAAMRLRALRSNGGELPRLAWAGKPQ